MKVGRRLATKILNASRFALLQTEPNGPVTAPLDKAMLLSLARLVSFATKKLEEYDYTSALSEIEKSFWNFCDDYIELVKARRYGDFGAESASSANGALLVALETYLRLFAPYLPFVTAEVWSWWRCGSVHRAPWPDAAELERVADTGADARLYIDAQLVNGEIRRQKSLQGMKIKTPVKVVIVADAATLSRLRMVEREIASANTATIVFQQGDALHVSVLPSEEQGGSQPTP
jgi:valyl-tRNA synthetase